METIFEYFNSNYTWIFSGIGVAAVSGIFWWLKKFSNAESGNSVSIDADNSIVNSGSKNNTNVNNIFIGTLHQENKTYTQQSETNQKLIFNKGNVQILFIDDETFELIQILKDSGIPNVNRLKDVKKLDDPKILSSQIIFVDINGVGEILKFKNQGIGLAKSIKERYPNKKVVLYSGINTWNIFDEDLKYVDAKLSKMAEPIEFITLIEKYIEQFNA